MVSLVQVTEQDLNSTWLHDLYTAAAVSAVGLPQTWLSVHLGPQTSLNLNRKRTHFESLLQMLLLTDHETILLLQQKYIQMRGDVRLACSVFS